MNKRYTIDYCSGATGYGWRYETDSRKEAEDTALSMSKSYSAAVTVWDSKAHDFIYDKSVLEYKPRVNLF